MKNFKKILKKLLTFKNKSDIIIKHSKKGENKYKTWKYFKKFEKISKKFQKGIDKTEKMC